jgi:hypothetical protein
MATGADTIRARGIPQAPRWAVRLMIVMAILFAGGVAAATAISLAADQATDEPAVIQPVRPSELDDRKSHGTGGSSPSDADGIRDPSHLPKR